MVRKTTCSVLFNVYRWDDCITRRMFRLSFNRGISCLLWNSMLINFSLFSNTDYSRRNPIYHRLACQSKHIFLDNGIIPRFDLRFPFLISSIYLWTNSSIWSVRLRMGISTVGRILKEHDKQRHFICEL